MTIRGFCWAVVLVMLLLVDATITTAALGLMAGALTSAGPSMPGYPYSAVLGLVVASLGLVGGICLFGKLICQLGRFMEL